MAFNHSCNSTAESLYVNSSVIKFIRYTFYLIKCKDTGEKIYRRQVDSAVLMSGFCTPSDQPLC